MSDKRRNRASAGKRSREIDRLKELRTILGDTTKDVETVNRDALTKVRAFLSETITEKQS